MALRLRRVGKQWLQTLKGGGGMRSGLHQRNEWEVEVAGEALDFDSLEACIGKPINATLRKKLRPQFVTDFSRNSRIIVFEGAEIELCLDSGEIRAGKANRPISELELELKSGTAKQLFQFALILLEIVPIEIEYTSKAEYGYRLCSGYKPGVSKANYHAFPQFVRLVPALQSTVEACLYQLQANIQGAIHKHDDEYLHQIRVALRRLRVVLAMTERFHADAMLDMLHVQVAALCVELGCLRDWDVFATQTLVSIRSRFRDEAGFCAVVRASEHFRELHHAAVKRVLQSENYQRFLLCFGVWMHGEYWDVADKAGISPTDFAVQLLDKRSRQVAKLARNLSTADAETLHLLRIACKKLRYSADIFASQFDPDITGHYLAALGKLQDILGKQNDMATAHRLLDELDNVVPLVVTKPIRAQIDLDCMANRVKLDKACRKFFRQTSFWRGAAKAAQNYPDAIE